VFFIKKEVKIINRYQNSIEQESEKAMKVEIWSDIACPWCYIGKRRFESALSQFEHRDQVEIEWRSFQLDPTAPRISNESHDDHLAKKFRMSSEQIVKMNEQMIGLANEEGLTYHFEQIKQANTFDGHRLIHLAKAHGLQGEMKERLMHAYWTEGVALWDVDALVKLAVEVGLDADEARTTLESDAYADEVRADVRRAQSLNISGVPFFVVDEKYGVSGAQPSEVFSKVLTQTWAESHPLINIVGTSQDAGMCDDGRCAI
jgi:predicted DsbA family dithiol-disulfide isomerase